MIPTRHSCQKRETSVLTLTLRFIQGLWQLLEARVDIFPTCLTSSGVTMGHKNINKSTGGLGDPVFPLKLTRAAA